MDVKALVAELEKVTKQANDIATEFKDKEAPAEKKSEFSKLVARGKELRSQIEEAQKAADEHKDLVDLHAFLARPGAVTHPAINADEDGRKALIARGWEIKGGMLYAPTSQGKHVEMFHEGVLFGEMPKDQVGEHFYRTTRAAMQSSYKAAYGHYLVLIAQTKDMARAWTALSDAEQKALAEGQDTTGGFLVPPDYQAELLARTAQKSVMRRYARVQNTTRDLLRFPRVQAHATSGSIYSSGFVGGWAGETPAFTDTDPAFGTFDVAVKKARVATKLANDFIADSAIDVLAWLAQNGAENLALVEDNGFIAGDGSALQPKGILNSGAATVDVAGTTANTISNTTAATGTAPKIIDVIFAVPPQYRGDGAVWLATPTSEGKLRKLVDAQGRYHWPLSTSIGGGFGAGQSRPYTQRLFADYPMENSPFMQEDGTALNKVLVFGSISDSYVIAQRAQISTVVLRERFADTDQTGIIIFERVGGDTWNPDAIRIGTV